MVIIRIVFSDTVFLFAFALMFFILPLRTFIKPYFQLKSLEGFLHYGVIITIGADNWPPKENLNPPPSTTLTNTLKNDV